MAGLREAASAYGLSLDEFLTETDLVIHGSTVATNTLVERKGATVGLITTDGFRDLLEMREGLKEDRYNLRMTPVEPLAARYLRVEVPERIRANGAVHHPLDTAALDEQLDYLQREGAESLAVCFLFSYLNPDHEQQAGEIIRRRFPDMYTSLSHEVIPQIKEFDRLSTTVINSYVGPGVQPLSVAPGGAVPGIPSVERRADYAVQRRCGSNRRFQPHGGAGYPVRPGRWSQRRRVPGPTAGTSRR